ncbi:hypothetical protein H9Q70_000069 [Fusarium xylarioides]|nr:hypothetical protein H9Q70_000069 [Fusarium xylarioides]
MFPTKQPAGQLQGQCYEITDVKVDMCDERQFLRDLVGQTDYPLSHLVSSHLTPVRCLQREQQCHRYPRRRWWLFGVTGDGFSINQFAMCMMQEPGASAVSAHISSQWPGSDLPTVIIGVNFSVRNFHVLPRTNEADPASLP